MLIGRWFCTLLLTEAFFTPRSLQPSLFLPGQFFFFQLTISSKNKATSSKRVLLPTAIPSPPCHPGSHQVLTKPCACQRPPARLRGRKMDGRGLPSGSPSGRGRQIASRTLHQSAQGLPAQAQPRCSPLAGEQHFVSPSLHAVAHKRAIITPKSDCEGERR